jgi:hypothetical protein
MRSLAKAASQTLSHVSNPPSPAQVQADQARQAEYNKAAWALLGSSRTGEANDPEAYVASIIRILSAYPLDIVWRVVDPLDGLPGKLEWLPKPYEVKKALDEIYVPRKARERAHQQLIEQLQERQRIEAMPQPQQTRDDIRAEMQRRGFPMVAAAPVFEGDVGVIKKRYGISDVEWDMIPDAPDP